MMNTMPIREQNLFDSLSHFTEEGRQKSVEYLQGYVNSYEENCRVRNFLGLENTKVTGYKTALEEKLKQTR